MLDWDISCSFIVLYTFDVMKDLIDNVLQFPPILSTALSFSCILVRLLNYCWLKAKRVLFTDGISVVLSYIVSFLTLEISSSTFQLVFTVHQMWALMFSAIGLCSDRKLCQWSDIAFVIVCKRYHQKASTGVLYSGQQIEATLLLRWYVTTLTDSMNSDKSVLMLRTVDGGPTLSR